MNKKEEILKKLKDLQELYPYKVVGDSSTYCSYNEAWTDAIAAAIEYWEEYAATTQPEGVVASALDGGLLPCPFCGGKAEVLQSGKLAVEVKCTSCRIGLEQKTIRYSVDWLKQRLTDRWNKRQQQLSPSPLDAVGSFLDWLFVEGYLDVEFMKECGMVGYKELLQRYKQSQTKEDQPEGVVASKMYALEEAALDRLAKTTKRLGQQSVVASTLEDQVPLKHYTALCTLLTKKNAEIEQLKSAQELFSADYAQLQSENAALQQQLSPSPPVEAVGFAEWLSLNRWKQVRGRNQMGKWYIPAAGYGGGEPAMYTTKQLYQLYKSQTKEDQPKTKEV